MRDAVANTGTAIGPNGKIQTHKHQRRVGRRVLAKARTALLSRLTDIESCQSFDELLILVKEATLRIDRFGELAVHDTALRIGAWRNLSLSPEFVYLHAGTRKGASALGLGRGKEYLEMDELPIQLRRLTPNQVEDLLCIFEDHLRSSRNAKRRTLSGRC